jgi:hypothetical protein
MERPLFGIAERVRAVHRLDWRRSRRRLIKSVRSRIRAKMGSTCGRQILPSAILECGRVRCEWVSGRESEQTRFNPRGTGAFHKRIWLCAYTSNSPALRKSRDLAGLF